MSLRDLLHSFLDPDLTADRPGAGPFRLGCSLEGPASAAEIVGAWPDPSALPAELVELWSVTREARLFVDLEHGRWGLDLLGPAASAAATHEGHQNYLSDDLAPDDVVIGRFVGDQERLVYAPSEAPDRRLLVAEPLDDRRDWAAPGSSLVGFLVAYRAAGGDWFWTRAPRPPRAT